MSLKIWLLLEASSWGFNQTHHLCLLDGLACAACRQCCTTQHLALCSMQPHTIEHDLRAVAEFEWACTCRLEAVLYSLTAGARELLHLRTPALADLHLACAAASLACAKRASSPQPPAASVSLPQLPAEQQQQIQLQLQQARAAPKDAPGHRGPTQHQSSDLVHAPSGRSAEQPQTGRAA